MKHESVTFIMYKQQKWRRTQQCCCGEVVSSWFQSIEASFINFSWVLVQHKWLKVAKAKVLHHKYGASSYFGRCSYTT